jgi:tetratricopeptide (TPR) repeat protein
MSIRPIIASAALVIACLLAYSPALNGQFLWDDDRHVSQNKALRSLDGLRRIWLVPRTAPQYYPLTHTTFWIEWHLRGDRTIGYHIVNVLLHATNALVLWRLLRMLEVPGAWAAAMLFALHPIQVETVAWITERKNLLSMLFYLCALIAWWRGVNKDAKYPLAAFVCFVLALLAKTIACSMPAVALVILWWKRGTIRLRDVLPLLPFFAVGLGLAVLTGWMERTHVGATGPDWQLSPIQRLLIASRAEWFYAAKLFWPVRLTFSYPRWEISSSHAWQYLFVVTCTGLLAALWFLRHRIGRGPLAAVVIFGGVLVPALGFVNTYPMRYSFVADHFQYMAGAALIALVVAVLFRANRSAATVISLVIGCVCLVLTWRQAHAYASPEALWRDTIAKNPQSWMARNNLAVVLSQLADADRAAGREADARFKLGEADAQLALADPLRPQHEMLPFTWGDVLMKLDRPQEAIVQYERYLARARLNDTTRRTVALAHDRIGEALLELHRPNEATHRFERSLLIAPRVPETWLHLAAVCDQQDQTAEAIGAYEEYCRLVPHNAQVLTWLGQLYGRVGRFNAAAATFRAALDVDPTLAAAKRGLAMAQAMQRRAVTKPSSRALNTSPH